MSDERDDGTGESSGSTGHMRRKRYSGTHPRRFHEKYKELAPERYPETVQRVLESGKTPAGTHRSIMVQEILDVLSPCPGSRAVDCTLGWGGHSVELLSRMMPGGHLLGLDCDPLELPRTEARLRGMGYDAGCFTAVRTNFAGLSKAVMGLGWDGADMILADLGVSSMQIDNPERGFSVKHRGPLDMRMNPNKGISAWELVLGASAQKLGALLLENSDEPHWEPLGERLAGRRFGTTMDLAKAVQAALPGVAEEELKLTIRRTFQALRIAVNDEFGVLDSMLAQLPFSLRAGGRVAILTFHSGEDRRVKRAFRDGLALGHYAAIAKEVVRATPEERRANPRSKSAKLRWAVAPR